MNIQTQSTGDRFHIRADSLTTAPAILWVPLGEIATIAIKPPAAGTILVELSASSTRDIHAGDGLFIPAEGMAAGGVVSAVMLDTIPSAITAVRITASAAGGRVEICQEA